MSRPLPQSLLPLARIAAKEAGADGFAIYTVDPSTETRELQLAWGAPVPETSIAGLTVDAYPLRADGEITGIVAFVFRGNAVSPHKRTLLERITIAIEEVWRLWQLPSSHALQAARIGELETELADSKIADRARGLLSNSALPGDSVDTIARHVESVSRPGQLATVLAQLSQEIEQEIAERELASRAKAVLQSRYGMSEDQAHVHLRLVSRKSRKRLRDVAQDLLRETAVSGD